MADRPLIGVFLMLGFCILAPLGDAVAKLLGQSMSVGFLVFVRFAMQAAIFGALVVLLKSPLPKTPRLIRLTALRTLLHIGGLGCMFASLQYLPLADAVAIAFVMPFIMLLLGWAFLNEHVGPHRLGACTVGFIGTLLVIQPNFAEVGTPALLPVAVAVIFAFFMLVTRQIAKDVDPIGLQAMSGIMATPILIAALVMFPGVPLFETSPIIGGQWWLLAALGTLGAMAHLMMTWSLRYAPSATVAPMQYLEIPVSTFVGYLVFRDLPNGLAALGIIITIAAGLYIILRERRLAQLQAQHPMQTAGQ